MFGKAKLLGIILAGFLLALPGNAATNVETGQFAASTVSATTTVVTLAQYKCAILWTTGQTSTGSDSAANAMWSIGFSDSTNHRTIAWASDDNVGTTNVGQTLRTDAALEILSDGTPTSVITVTDVNFSALSVDVVFSGTPAAAYLISYKFIGGSDITDCLVGTHTLDTATGADSITGLSFQPNFGMFLTTQQTAAGTGTRTTGGLGFAVSSTKEFAMCWGIDDAATMTANIDAVSYTDANAMMCGITPGAETITLLVDFTSFDSGGATFNISNAAGAVLMPYLLIKGGQWDVGTVTTATGANTVSSMSFQPKGLFVGTSSATTDATVTIDATVSVGAATSTSTEASSGAHQEDAVLNTSVVRETESTKIVSEWVLTGTGLNGQADFTSFQSNGWTITFDASIGRQLGWFAMGDNAAPPTERPKRRMMVID